MLQVIHLADDEGLAVGLGVEALGAAGISWREAMLLRGCFAVSSGSRHTETCEVRCCAAVESEQIETSCRLGPRSQAHKSTPSQVSCGRSLHLSRSFFSAIAPLAEEFAPSKRRLLVRPGD